MVCPCSNDGALGYFAPVGLFLCSAGERQNQCLDDDFLSLCAARLGRQCFGQHFSGGAGPESREKTGRQPDLPPQFLDEIDNLYNAASKDGATDLTTAILNGGHKRGNTYERMVGTNNDQVKVFGIFGPVAMAGLGKARLPDSLADRIIRIPMEPVKPGESVERFRQRILEGEHKTYRDALSAFCERADGKIDIDEVTIPEALNGRDIDNWEPLLAVADVADGDWPARARRAAVRFCVEKAMTKRDTLALRLLKEVVEYLQEVTKASTDQIYQHLYNKAERPGATSSSSTRVGSGTRSISFQCATAERCAHWPDEGPGLSRRLVRRPHRTVHIPRRHTRHTRHP